MQSYAYLGANLANQANQRRQQSQGMAQMYGRYAPQQSQLNVQGRQFRYQQAQNALANQDRMRNFGITALAGLMR